MVAATGGPRSIFTFLYVLAVAGASVVLARLGALVVAAASSLLYTAVVMGRTVLPLSLFFEPPLATTAFPAAAALGAGRAAGRASPALTGRLAGLRAADFDFETGALALVI